MFVLVCPSNSSSTSIILCLAIYICLSYLKSFQRLIKLCRIRIDSVIVVFSYLYKSFFPIEFFWVSPKKKKSKKKRSILRNNRFVGPTSFVDSLDTVRNPPSPFFPLFLILRPSIYPPMYLSISLPIYLSFHFLYASPTHKQSCGSNINFLRSSFLMPIIYVSQVSGFYVNFICSFALSFLYIIISVSIHSFYSLFLCISLSLNLIY